ncbi:TIGR04282 family arsenosugar biosynthesis glycosyltransferase [Boseongicola aestuarii]|uniref:2-phospho-L-lactate guanylyltransferase n=1 Tax=Boseongicola aestuarii TaxID=1470561 RepID=A0A238IYS8_9RHOB|nr:TIGR04282 family arsenosugar biosynthesis glycosyltransferase [Boseongicola aestuarii]SMX23025.1 2-phospho-L-lactate guanylyltransferase [Boseongicola aestuarii]
MLKEPRPGRVKTRLGRDIGLTTAAWWFRHQTRRLIRRLEDPRWHLILAVSPDREGLQSRIWPEHIDRLPQGPGTLGDRMARMLRSTPGPTLVIGADIPAVTTSHIALAFQTLNQNASVLGPAPDGGYWLVGLKHPARARQTLFQHVRWSTRHALQDTAKTLPEPTALTATLQDIDTAKDL